MIKLRAKDVYIESSLKLFGLEKGESHGSTLGVTFEIPDGVSELELKKAILAEKESLDLTVATMELAKGTMSRPRYDKWKERLKDVYNRLLGRKEEKSHDRADEGESDAGEA